MTEINKNTGWRLDNSYGRLPKNFYSRQNPVPVSSPRLIKLNLDLAGALGLDAERLQSEEGVAELSGNRIPEGSVPIAQAYAGHQFGYFTMLGDGRALLLGEQITPDGKRFDIQLKGSGRTPYSRDGDGRAALGPMLREYIISEAMHALGIETTRSLAVVATGEQVYRETALPGAILTRVADSHIRVGTFQYASAFGSADDLKALADYTIKRHYPLCAEDANPYLSLLEAAVLRQAELIAKWQLAGFIHGVMNTDNMALSGETIDYGPCAFMDSYNPDTVFSSIDRYGRYAYKNQPLIAAWNLARFAETLLPLIDNDGDKAASLAQNAVSKFMPAYNASLLAGMRAKLGLFAAHKDESDGELIEGLLEIMRAFGADYTNTFLSLTFDEVRNTPMFDSPRFLQWHGKWQERLKRQNQTAERVFSLMKAKNPAVIPRNHRVEEALEAAVKRGDYSVMDRLLEVLKDPYAHTPRQREYAQPPPPSFCDYKTFCGT